MCRVLEFSSVFVLISAMGCGADDTSPIDPGADAGPGDGGEAGPAGIKGGAALAYVPIYEAVEAIEPGTGEARPWIPIDLDLGHDGALWVLQRMDRLPGFTDATECTSRGQASSDPSDDDCFGLQGSTVTLTDPTAAELATADNGRARLVVDANSLHFLRRPSGIAFGLERDTLEPGEPGTMDGDGRPLVTSTQTYTNLFATCHEHETGNLTDDPPFIGPTLWTGDPAIYGRRPFSWSNGAHLDMVHATQHCMGIAWERDNVYWTLNGRLGTLDRYDFGKPHLPGHFYHEDAVVERYFWTDFELARVQDVPMNMAIADGTLYLSDTGAGRVLAVDLTADVAPFGSFSTFERLSAQTFENPAMTVLVDAAALAAMWGGAPQPSGIAVFDDETLVAIDHASGNLSLIDRGTGGDIRTIDTGLGSGAGGLTVADGTIYFAHMTERKVYRVDVME
jgi:hypothetical protein